MDDQSWTGSDKSKKSLSPPVRSREEIPPDEEVPSPSSTLSDLDQEIEDTISEPPEPSPLQESISQNTRPKNSNRKKNQKAK